MLNEKSVSKAQQRFMGMVHAVQKGDMEAPSSEVEKAADSMSDADAKDYASTKHKGLPNHVKKENMEKELKEIIRQTYRESLRESINEDAAELPQATIPSAVKIKLQMAIDKIKDSKLSNNAKLQLVAQVIDALDVDKSQLSNIANKIRSKMESVNESISHEAMGIASMTNTRKEAVQKFIDDNNLNAKEILTHITKGKLPERIRFVQALVGTPNNSSFKWYVKTYANESVVTEGIWPKSKLASPFQMQLSLELKKKFKGIFYSVGYDLYRNNKKVLTIDGDDDSINSVIAKLKKIVKESVNEGKKAFKINPPIGSSKYSISAYDGITKHKDGSPFYDILIFKNKADLERRAKYFRGEKYIEESINEGKKAFKINPPIGSSKYSISAYDGITKHKDGSPFYDILIFKNKADLERRAKYFRGEKYIEESVNEMYTWKDIDTLSITIGNFAQLEKNIVKKFIEDNNLDIAKIYKDSNRLDGRTLFAKVIDAGPNSKIQKDYIRKFALKSGKLTEGRYDSDLDKVEAVVKNATSFMNVGSELKKAGIKYDFTTSMIPMYMIKVSGNTIAICNKKYAAGAEREVNDIAIGLLN